MPDMNWRKYIKIQPNFQKRLNMGGLVSINEEDALMSYKEMFFSPTEGHQMRNKEMDDWERIAREYKIDTKVVPTISKWWKFKFCYLQKQHFGYYHLDILFTRWFDDYEKWKFLHKYTPLFIFNIVDFFYYRSKK